MDSLKTQICNMFKIIQKKILDKYEQHDNMKLLMWLNACSSHPILQPKSDDIVRSNLSNASPWQRSSNPARDPGRSPSISRASPDPHSPSISFKLTQKPLRFPSFQDHEPAFRWWPNSSPHPLWKKVLRQNPNLQLFPPLLLLLAPAIKKSANEGKLKLQTFCIFNDNHLGNSNLTEWMMQNHLPASHLSKSLETTQSCKQNMALINMIVNCRL